MQEAKGVEVLKQGLGTMLEVAATIVEVTDDKKVTFLETVRIGMKAFPIADVIRHRHELRDELQDLSEAEKAELEAFICSKFHIPDDAVEETIEHALALLVDLLGFGFAMGKIWDKKEGA